MAPNRKLILVLMAIGLAAHVLALVAIVTRSIPAHLDAFALAHRGDSTFRIIGVICAVQSVCVIPLLFYRSRVRTVLGLSLGVFFLTLLAGTPFWTSVGRYDAADDTSYLAWSHALGYELTGMVSKEANPGWTSDNHHTWGTGLMLAPAMMLTKMIDPTANGFNNTGLSLVSTLSFLWAVLSVWLFFLTYKKFMSESTAALMAFATLAGTSLVKWAYVRNIFSHSVEAAALSIAGYACAVRYRDRDFRTRWQVLTLLALVLLVQIRREDIMFFVIPAWLSLVQPNRSTGFRKIFASLIYPSLGVVLSILLLVLSNKFTAGREFGSAPSLKDFKEVNEWASAIRASYFSVLFDSDTGMFSLRNIWAYFGLGYILLNWRSIKACAPFVFVTVATIFMCLLHLYPTGCEWQNRFTLKLNGPIFLAAGMFIEARGPKFRLLSWGLFLASIAWQLSRYRDNTARSFIYFYEVFADKYLLNPLPSTDMRHLFLYLPLFLTSLAVMVTISVTAHRLTKKP